MIRKLISKRGVQENLSSTAKMWLDFLLLRFMVISVSFVESCVLRDPEVVEDSYHIFVS